MMLVFRKSRYLRSLYEKNMYFDLTCSGMIVARSNLGAKRLYIIAHVEFDP